MFSLIWHTLFFNPIYNSLVLLIDNVPGGDVGVAIILLTVFVKLVLLPLSIKATRTQFLMQGLEGKLAEIKEKYKDNREEQARATMKVYSDAGVNPFASSLLMFIQIPILIALYMSVSNGGGVHLPAINTVVLYSFVKVPAHVNTVFLGLVDVVTKSLPLALLAGITQFFQAYFAVPPLPKSEKPKEPSFKDDFARSMHLQMRYVIPVVIFFVAYKVNAVVALYFIVSNIFSITQELFIKKSGVRTAPQS